MCCLLILFPAYRMSFLLLSNDTTVSALPTVEVVGRGVAGSLFGFRLRTPAAAALTVLSVLLVGFELDWVIDILGGAEKRMVCT
jgi:hypothetical protein